MADSRIGPGPYDVLLAGVDVELDEEIANTLLAGGMAVELTDGPEPAPGGNYVAYQPETVVIQSPPDAPGATESENLASDTANTDEAPEASE